MNNALIAFLTVTTIVTGTVCALLLWLYAGLAADYLLLSRAHDRLLRELADREVDHAQKD